jgi:hypothetical protein
VPGEIDQNAEKKLVEVFGKKKWSQADSEAL